MLCKAHPLLILCHKCVKAEHPNNGEITYYMHNYYKMYACKLSLSVSILSTCVETIQIPNMNDYLLLVYLL